MNQLESQAYTRTSLTHRTWINSNNTHDNSWPHSIWTWTRITSLMICNGGYTIFLFALSLCKPSRQQTKNNNRKLVKSAAKSAVALCFILTQQILCFIKHTNFQYNQINTFTILIIHFANAILTIMKKHRIRNACH